jgi:NitT/TauT family transport system substrate-binding protein
MHLPRMSYVFAAAAFLAVPGTASAQQKLVVAMPTTPPNVVHMPVHIAIDLGLFKKHGLTVETVALEGGVKTYRAMVSGNADIASAPGPFSIVGLSKGAPTKLILANMPTLSASMVVRDNIKTMADLKGKRIGIQQPGGFADILSRGVLRAAKIDPKEVNFVSIATEDVPALIANQVDTAILHPEQEIIAQKKVPSLHAIARMWEIQPDNLYNVFAVTKKTVADKGPALQAFVKGHIEAARMMYTDRDKVLPVIVKRTGLPRDVAEKALDLLVKNCIFDGNHGLGPKKVNATAKLMERVGNIEKGKVPSYEDIVELSFAKAALKDLGPWKGPMCPTEAF